MTISAAKPTASASRAVSPAMNRRRNVHRAATQRDAPRPMSCLMPFIFWVPWLTPMANTRKGTSTENGFSVSPSMATRPSCQTTAITEHASTSAVLRQQRV